MQSWEQSTTLARVRTRCGVIFVLLLLTGCATQSSPFEDLSRVNASRVQASPPSGATKNSTGGVEGVTPGASQQIEAELRQQWDAAMKQCAGYLSQTREAFYGTGKRELSIATLGIVAGSLVVPALAAKAAAKSTVAAWGGVSGTVNAYQLTSQQKGTSAFRIAQGYEATRKEVLDASEAYIGASDTAGRTKALAKLIIACQMPALPTLGPAADPPAPPNPNGPA